MIEPAKVGKAESFDGTRISYQCFGAPSAPPLVLGNGIGVGYAGLERPIATLAQRHWVVCWDHRGVFASDPPGPGGVGMAAHAGDCLALVDALALGRPRYLGWSMGVQVGLEAWRARPGTFVRMAFVSGVAGNPFRAALPIAGLERAIASALRRAARLGVALRPLLARVVASEGFVAGARLLGLLGPQADERLFRTMTRGVASHDPDLYLRTLAELAAHEAEGVLPTIDVPLLFVAGEADRMTPAREIERLARLASHGEVRLVPRTSHFLPIEDPAALDLVLRDFFAG